ncbi:MAG TPA: DUF559 domain-containing protein [Deinococcales bacterium]|nr:DUF559 domain-containing protein [Deinococcales bacterium]
MDRHAHARQMRLDPTRTEQAFWRLVRGEALGVKFRRQHVIGPYIADFACVPLRLVVEVDGGQHFESAHDRERDAWLEGEGWKVVRYWNPEVLTNPQGVQEHLLTLLEERRAELRAVRNRQGERPG